MSPAAPSRRARAALLLAAVALCAPATAGAAAAVAPGDSPPTLEALMAGMASARGVVAEFRETKQVALLREPLESRGVLHFVPPDRLVRQVLEPAPSKLVIHGERMWLEDASGAPPVDMSSDPAARQFVSNFVVLFSGDLDALRRRYDTTFTAGPDGWSLRLVPRDALVRRFVEAISLRGSGETMREMVLVESDGDRTTTRFDHVETDHAHTPEELRALFGDADAAGEARPHP